MRDSDTYLLEQALALSPEWISVIDLPGDPNSGTRCNEYDTLVYFGLAERRSETIYSTNGLPCGVKVYYRLDSRVSIDKIDNLLSVARLEEEKSLRYQEESTTRENPLRIGTKRIKISGVEYPFIAVSDHWRPALLHESRLVWISLYKEVKGLREKYFRVYYVTEKVPYNRLPWTVNNKSDWVEYKTLIEAVNVALLIAQEKEAEVQRSNAASLLGRKGGLVKSEVKAEKVRENGKKGGRPKSTSISPDLSLFED